MYLSLLLFSSTIPVHISSYTRPLASLSMFIRHSTTHYLLVHTFAHSLSFSLSLMPVSLSRSFLFLSPSLLFRKVSVNSPSDFDECNSEISSSRRELVIVGRAAQRSSIYAHTLCGDNPATGPSRNGPLLRI